MHAIMAAMLASLLFGCATNGSKSHGQSSVPNQKVILGGAKEIDDRCYSDNLKQRNIRCVFVPAGNRTIPFPEWFEELMELSGKQIRTMQEEALYQERMGRYSFVPIVHTQSFADKLFSRKLFTFIVLDEHLVDGVPVYTAMLKVIRLPTFEATQEFNDEIWGVVDKTFRTAPNGAPEVARFVADQKAAIAEEKRKIDEQEKLAALEKYRQAFKDANTPEQLASFIKEYETNDPDGFILLAKQKMQRLSDEKKETERKSAITILESRIAEYKQRMTNAQSVIDKERRIGEMSGYVNMLTLHNAAQFIMNGETAVLEYYKEYRNVGGTKALDEIK